MKKLIALLFVLVANIVLAGPGGGTGGFSEPNLTLRPPPCCDV